MMLIVKGKNILIFFYRNLNSLNLNLTFDSFDDSNHIFLEENKISFDYKKMKKKNGKKFFQNQIKKNYKNYLKKKKLNQYDLKKKEELKELTFNPKINKRSKSIANLKNLKEGELFIRTKKWEEKRLLKLEKKKNEKLKNNENFINNFSYFPILTQNFKIIRNFEFDNRKSIYNDENINNYLERMYKGKEFNISVEDFFNKKMQHLFTHKKKIQISNSQFLKNKQKIHNYLINCGNNLES